MYDVESLKYFFVEKIFSSFSFGTDCLHDDKRT